MEALINSDFIMAEDARDILLHRESKLADIAAQWKRQWHSVEVPKVSQAAAPAAHAVLPTGIEGS